MGIADQFFFRSEVKVQGHSETKCNFVAEAYTCDDKIPKLTRFPMSPRWTSYVVPELPQRVAQKGSVKNL